MIYLRQVFLRTAREYLSDFQAGRKALILSTKQRFYQQIFIPANNDDKRILMKMSDQISAAIARVTREEVDINNVRNSKDLISELGLNSIARMKLVLELERTFGVEIDLDKMDISVFKTVDALENYIQQNSKVIPENN